MPMQLTDLRSFNTAQILHTLNTSEEPLSRADLAKITGLTKPTVSKLVDTLIAATLVVEDAPTSRGRSGRPISPARIADGTICGIGLEFSADHIALQARDLAGNILFEKIAAGKANSVDDALTRASTLMKQALDTIPQRCLIAGIAASIPGRVDHSSRHIQSAPNLGWEDLAFAELLDQRFGRLNPDLPPTQLVNDAHILTQVELSQREGETFMVIYGETGIGGALVFDGKIFEGTQGWVGEIGHVTVDPNGPECRCGKRGCLESFASAWAMKDSAKLGEEVSINEIPAHLTPYEHHQIGTSLGIALANTITLLDISTVVFAGYLNTLLPAIRPFVVDAINTYALDAHHRRIQLQPQFTADNAALLGASLRALEPVFENPVKFIQDHGLGA